jgi:hypothetical protein
MQNHISNSDFNKTLPHAVGIETYGDTQFWPSKKHIDGLSEPVAEIILPARYPVRIRDALRAGSS